MAEITYTVGDYETRASYKGVKVGAVWGPAVEGHWFVARIDSGSERFETREQCEARLREPFKPSSLGLIDDAYAAGQADALEGATVEIAQVYPDGSCWAYSGQQARANAERAVRRSSVPGSYVGQRHITPWQPVPEVTRG